MFLSDDRNTAIFPDDAGTYSVHVLADKGHYEVNGDSTSPTQVSQPQQPLAHPSAQSASQSPRFSFASSSRGSPNSGQQAWASTPPVFRRPQSKTFAR